VHAGPHTRRALAPVVIRPPRALGAIIGGAFTAWALIFGIGAVVVAANGPAEFKTFLAWFAAAVLFVLALIFANWTYSLATLHYVIDNGALHIHWGFREAVVPIASIQRLVPGRTIEPPKVQGLRWWGCHIGGAETPRLGFTLFYSTHSRPDELLYIVTDEETYALTVLSQAWFAEEIQARTGLAPLESTMQRTAGSGLGALPFWRDHVALVTLAVSALLCAALWGYVYASYPGLPDVVRLRFPDLGGVIRVGNKSELLRIAWLGAGILVVNALFGIVVHSRERAAGLWLIASGGMLQALLLGAAVLAFARA
jgi:hypothetical protein